MAHVARVTAVCIVKVCHDRHLAGNGRENFGQSCQRVVLGNHQWKESSPGFGPPFYTVHKGADPALIALWMLGQLGVEDHLHFSAEGGVVVKGAMSDAHMRIIVRTPSSSSISEERSGRRRIQAAESLTECCDKGAFSAACGGMQMHGLQPAFFAFLKALSEVAMSVGRARKISWGESAMESPDI